MTRCGAFETQTGRQCVLETDHDGAHVLESPLGRMCFDDLTEADLEAILSARRGQSLGERLRRENDRLREENERLRAGIEQEAIYLDMFTTAGYVSSCHRLRALLDPPA